MTNQIMKEIQIPEKLLAISQIKFFAQSPVDTFANFHGL